MSGFLDTRLLGRGTSFTGQDKDWPEFKIAFRAFVLASSLFTEVELSAIDTVMDPVEITQIPPKKEASNRS
eukprot:699293-Amphidinium_carterae.1